MNLNSGKAISEGHRRYLEARTRRIRCLRGFLGRKYPMKASLDLEIGCGHGHFLAAYASRHPRRECLGIDLVTRRIHRACRKRDKRQLPNLEFLKAEVTEFMEAMPGELHLERVFILFPDPWPKKRHAKNRILQDSLLDAIGSRAGPGTRVHFRTDHPEHFLWGKEIFDRHPDWTLNRDAPWPFENPSYFQDLLGSFQSLMADYRPARRQAEG